MNTKRCIAGAAALLLASSAAAQTPVFQYAVFYNGLLEFSTCPTMTINGRVHANGSIYTGTSASLTFSDTVTCTGTISSPAWVGQGTNGWASTGTYNGNPQYQTNVPGWVLPSGTTNFQNWLAIPPASEDPTSTKGQCRFYNQAQTILLVSNTLVTVKVQDSINHNVPGSDPSPLYILSTNTPAALATNFPFLSTTNSFTDQREGKTVQTTQIDVAKYANWITTNTTILSKFPSGSGSYPTILYVADCRTTTPSQMPGVRLINGTAPPVNGGLGWSVATPDPLYVMGNYNCTNSNFLGTTNTTSSMPCALMSDALTLLSPLWLDSHSSGPFTSRLARESTVNAAILTGIVPSTGSASSQFSGGVHNLPRLLENWSSCFLTLNTSLVCLFNSVVATNKFVNPGTYYNPPSRQFQFDPNFLNPAKLPPGTPLLYNPPMIAAPPLSQAALPGSNVTFSVSANGTAPLSYQWSFNGAAIAAATNASLSLSGVQADSVGNYKVVITNAAGAVTSPPAVLALAVPTDFLWAWSGATSSSYGNSLADSLATDTSGNLLVAGRFSTETLTLGGTILTNGTPCYGNFACKCDGSGNLLWAQPAGTNSGTPRSLRIGTDSAGNAWLAGHFSGTAVIGTNILVGSTPTDMFLVKYDPQGQVLWVRQVGACDTNLQSTYFGFAVDANGNAYLASRDTGSADFGSQTLTNSTAFLAKYDADGNLVWAQEALGADAIAVGTNGAICLVGSPGILAKYDNSGNLLWSRSFPIGRGITLDAQDNIYVTGYGIGTYDAFTITNSSGSGDMFVARCDSQGQILWLRQAGGVQQQRGSGIALDQFGNAYVSSFSAVGVPEPMLSFGPSTLTNVFTFAVKYDPSGNPLWARAITTTKRSSVYAVAAKDSAAVYLGGSFSGTASLGMSRLYCYPGAALFAAKLDGMERAAPPAIAGQPQSQCATAGSTAAFTVTVPSGIPLTYQWSTSPAGLIIGATSATLVLTNVQTADAGGYFVTVVNAYGSTNSAVATLSVNVPPAIATQPQSLLVLAGGTATFTVSATGTAPLSYQWQCNSTNLMVGTDATLLLTNVTTDLAGSYSVTVTNIAGVATSLPATLTVFNTAAAALALPPPATGGAFQLSLAGVPGFTYAIEASTNMVDWMPVLTNTAPFTFTDSDTTNLPARFYRAAYLP
jgi:hypothetical protein